MLNRAAFDTALGRRPADVIIKNGKVVNVYSGEIWPTDVAISDGVFSSFGDAATLTGPATEVVDAAGYHLVPGLIDTHVHTEASKMSLTSYAKAVLPHGTTAVYSAFDHIACVLGLDGVRLMLDEAAGLPFRVYNPLPCRVPHTIPASTIGGQIGLAEQQAGFGWPEARGIAEVAFDFLIRDEPELFQAIEECEKRRLLAHGDGPGRSGAEVDAMLCAGLRDDHEMTTMEQTVDRIRRGLYVMLRECPVGHNLAPCLRAVTEAGLSARRVALCSDDADATTLVQVGHVDNMVRQIIRSGVDPVTAIQMATLNGAEALRLDDRIGGIGPGRLADFLLVEDLSEFTVHATYVGGQRVAEDGKLTVPLSPPARGPLALSTFSLSPLSAAQLAVRTGLPDGVARALVMETKDGLVRTRREVELPVKDGIVLPDPGQDVLYISVVERFRDTGSRSTAFMSGLGLRQGAMAVSNVADDQNVVCVGADVESMVTAINRVAALRGAQVVARGPEVLAELPLPVAGCMTDADPADVIAAEAELNAAARALGTRVEIPFSFLMFTTITTMPFLSLTDKGLVEYGSFEYLDPVLGGA
jgi:adenine deaminase